MIKTKLIKITPELAKEYLLKNTSNRKIRERTVENYAVEMSKGRWTLNHQGIAFDLDGNLIDGQHRLLAIILSNKEIEMMVTTGLVNSSKEGVKIHVMDTVDRGNIRTVGDQLNIRHGIKNANIVAASCAVISLICCGTDSYKMNVSSTLEILKIFGQEIDFCIDSRSKIPVLRSAIPIGACSFAMKSSPENVKEFWFNFSSGENCKKGNPAYVCREYLMQKGFDSGRGSRTTRLYHILNCLKYHDSGLEIKQLKLTNLGLAYWVDKQRSRCSSIRSIFEINKTNDIKFGNGKDFYEHNS